MKAATTLVVSGPAASPDAQAVPHHKQVAALPYCRDDDGQILVLLVTSRTTRRWIIPKGWPIKGRRSRDTAAIEAFEEAGVKGKMARRPLGRFGYVKRDVDRPAMHCEVRVFALAVDRELDKWPEMNERERRWLRIEEAATLISDEGLRQIIADFARPSSRGD